MVNLHSIFLICLLFLGACASRMKDQMKEFRDSYARQDFDKASKILEGSVLKEDEKSALLWHLEKGTLELAKKNNDEAIAHFQTSLDLIDKLYTKRLLAKSATLFINDASDVFYGANYERSYAHYFLAKSLYFRYLNTGNKLDLQGARGTILAWDTYFTDLQRSLPTKTLYQTDLMLKVFGGEIHEVSEIRNDKQIALQLYKDALQILNTQGGFFSIFNSKNIEYIKTFEKDRTAPPNKLFEATPDKDDLQDFLHYKILSLTKDLRSSEFEEIAKTLNPRSETKKRASEGSGNVVLVLEEGLIPQKIGQPFNFGIKGAMNSVGDSNAKKVIATVGVEVLTAFAMNKLGMVPERSASPGSFIFAHDMTRLAVQEAAVEFELPMIENVPLVQRMEVFILNSKGVIVRHGPLPVVSENGDLARVVLEEDVVSRYTKTGVRVALKHISAIVAAIGVYNSLNSNGQGDFFAKTAAMATYVGLAKGIAAMEKADTRHWTTLPQALRIYEAKLPAGEYKIAVANYTAGQAPSEPSKILGDIIVKDSGKSIFTLSFNP